MTKTEFSTHRCRRGGDGLVGGAVSGQRGGGGRAAVACGRGRESRAPPLRKAPLDRLHVPQRARAGGGLRLDEFSCRLILVVTVVVIVVVVVVVVVVVIVFVFVFVVGLAVPAGVVLYMDGARSTARDHSAGIQRTDEAVYCV
eukprot:1616655-Rhodomonas_salina.4